MRRVLDPDAFVISSALTLYLVCWASALWFLFIPGVVVLHFASGRILQTWWERG